eukprot:2143073-Rhodomonas_salina.1
MRKGRGPQGAKGGEGGEEGECEGRGARRGLWKREWRKAQHATSGLIIISLAVVMDLELHSCNLAQAFIQADKLDEGVNRLIFVCPPQGATEDGDVVYE